VTLVAIAYPPERSSSAPVGEAPRDNRTQAVIATKPQATRPSVVEDGSDPESSEDPFAPRSWQVPPPPRPEPPPLAIVVTEPSAPQAPSGPPSLPYRFTGRFNDGGESIVYLSHGENVLVAKAGETLEGTYQVLAIEDRRIQLKHLPTGESQSLSLPASEN
jgi:hypothetical protein